MNHTSPLSHRESIEVTAPAEELYDLVSDVTRTGDWSPICTACWWDDPEQAGQVGAWFTGHNELPGHTWETRSQVVAARRGSEFAWVVGDGFVRWGFEMAAVEGGTELTETWAFLPSGLTMFHERHGARAEAEIAARTEQAHTGIPQTLAAIKRIAEATQGRPLLNG